VLYFCRLLVLYPLVLYPLVLYPLVLYFFRPLMMMDGGARRRPSSSIDRGV
jgi:hypothetical protein